MHDQLDENRELHLPRHFVHRTQRDGYAEREQRARRRSVLQKLHQPVEPIGGSKWIAAEAMPRTVAMMNGCSTMRLMTSSAVAAKLSRCGALSVIRKGTSANRSSVSKQKISATGTFAAGPRVASARPGPM